MRIIQINATYGVGSTGHIVQDIHRMLCANGQDSYVFWATASADVEDSEYIYRIGSEFDHKLHAVLRRIGKDQGFHSRYATKKVCKKLSQLQPDIVHLHNLHSNYIHFPTLMKFFRDEGISVLLTIHDSWFYTGYCTSYLKYGNCEMWREGCLHCPAVSKMFQCQVKRIYEKKMEGYSQTNNFYFNGVSHWTTEDIKNCTSIKAKGYSCIYNWIDTEIFKRYNNRDEVCRRYNIPTSRKIVLGVAQAWSNDKGLQEFMEISKLLHTEAVVVLIGEHERLQSDENLRFLGYTSDQRELAELYAAADVFVNPSSSETFGLVTAEAMACGTPVVAYRNTGTTELVTEKCGILVEDHNIPALLDAVSEMLSYPKTEYSEECIKNVLINFEKETQLKKYFLLYQKMKDEMSGKEDEA